MPHKLIQIRMKDNKNDSTTVLSRFGRDKRQRTVTATAERVERRPRLQRDAADSEQPSSEGPRGRASYNPHFTADNRPAFDKPRRQFGDKPAYGERKSGDTEDLCVAHYEVVQVGRSAAAVLAVTTAGYVRTRVARVRTGLSRENAAALAALLNRNLTFVAPVDLSNRLLAELCSQIDPELVPVISAAAAILQDSAQPHVFLGGEQYLLNWPQLEGKVGDILTLLNDEEQAAHIIAPPADRSESVLLGEDLEPQIPGLCIVSDRYLVGGGLWGTVALIGPTRMPFQKLMPLLHLFADELGEGMSGKRKDTPQMAAPRRTVIYKEDLE